MALGTQDEWNVILKNALDPNVEVKNVRPATDDEDILLINRSLGDVFHRVYGCEGEEVKQSRYVFHRYKMTPAMYWTLMRSAVATATYQNNDAALKVMACANIDGNFQSLLNHLLNKFNMTSLKFNSISTEDHGIVFYRNILFSFDAESSGESSAWAPGLTYEHNPQRKLISLTLDFSSRILWNWIESMRHGSAESLLSLSAFRQLNLALQRQTS